MYTVFQFFGKCSFIFFFTVNPGMQSNDILVLVFDVQAVDVHEKMFEKVIATFGKVSINAKKKSFHQILQIH